MADWLARAMVAIPAHRQTPTIVVVDSPIREWCVTYPNGASMDVLFHPPATRDVVAALYPGANLEPLPDAPRRQATPAEEAELRELVSIILADASDAERAEALRVALPDSEAALEYFRSLTAALPK